MKWLFAFLIFKSAVSFALSDRSRCLSKDLARQDCRLQQGKFKAQLSNKTVAWNNGIWQGVDELSLNGEGLTWEKAFLREIDGRLVLQMWIWDAGAGETKVQSLHWLVFDFAENKMRPQLKRVVRRRHVKTTDQGKVSYILDPMERHSLKTKLNKYKKVEWTHLKESGVF